MKLFAITENKSLWKSRHTAPYFLDPELTKWWKENSELVPWMNALLCCMRSYDSCVLWKSQHNQFIYWKYAMDWILTLYSYLYFFSNFDSMCDHLVTKLIGDWSMCHWLWYLWFFFKWQVLKQKNTEDNYHNLWLHELKLEKRCVLEDNTDSAKKIRDV